MTDHAALIRRRVSAVWRAVWKIAVFLVIWGALYAPLLLLNVAELRSNRNGSFDWARIYVEGAGVATILIAAWIMTRFVDRRPFRSLGFGRERMVRDAAVGAILGTCMMLLAVAILLGAGWAVVQPSGFVSSMALFLAAIGMLANTVTQEVLVRGYIQQTIRAEGGPTLAVVLSAAIFALLHWGATHGALLPNINLFAVGVLLGLGYQLTANLWLPIALHLAWNFLEGPVFGMTVSGLTMNAGWTGLHVSGPTLFTGGTFGVEGGVVATCVTAIGLLVLVLWRPSSSDRRATNGLS